MRCLCASYRLANTVIQPGQALNVLVRPDGHKSFPFPFLPTSFAYLDIDRWIAFKLNHSYYLHSFLFFQLEMEDEDTIDVFQQQTGGSSI